MALEHLRRLLGVDPRKLLEDAHGPGAQTCLPTPEPALRDVAPALLGVLGIPSEADTGASRPRPYTPEEESRVAERLRALGYLE